MESIRLIAMDPTFPHDDPGFDPAAMGADLSADPFTSEVEVVAQSPDPLRVLLIEDDPDHAALVEAYVAGVSDPAIELTHEGTVEAGTATIREAQDGGDPFHAILTDQQLPDSAYFETVGRVVAAAGASPVVALTSLGEMDLALDAVRAGASDYLVKAELTPELLRRTLRYAVERAQRDEALRETNDALRRTLRHARQMQAQIVEQEKLAGLGRLLSGVAHEIRNPLGLVVNSAEAIVSEASELRDTLTTAELPAAAREILDSVDRLAASIARNGRRVDTTVRSMYTHASGVEGRTQTTNLSEAARVALAQVDPGAEVELDLDDVSVRGVGSALVRMIVNVLENAVHASSGPDGRIRITTRSIVQPDGRPAAELTVEDAGPGWGLEPDHALRPFVSTWSGHLGLGLSMARTIAVSHEGHLHLGTSDLGGALVRVTMPIDDDLGEAEPPA